MIIRRFATTIQGIDPEIGVRGYQVVCRYVLNFFNAFLKERMAALSSYAVSLRATVLRKA